jgi:hypothetical protein
MENSAYMESITAARALALSEDEWLAGDGMLSVETQEGMNDDDFTVFTREHFPKMLRAIRALPKEQQEMLLSYYLLNKTQSTLARFFGITQTICSFRLRMSVKLVGCYMMMNGRPDAQKMRPILIRHGLEHKLKTPLSELIEEYARCRSFAAVAYRHKIHRPDIRRAMSEASKALLDISVHDEHEVPSITDPEGIALGAYIHSLIDRANPDGIGTTKRQSAKSFRVFVVTEPACTGEFRIAVNDPGFAFEELIPVVYLIMPTFMHFPPK